MKGLVYGGFGYRSNNADDVDMDISTYSAGKRSSHCYYSIVSASSVQILPSLRNNRYLDHSNSLPFILLDYLLGL